MPLKKYIAECLGTSVTPARSIGPEGEGRKRHPGSKKSLHNQIIMPTFARFFPAGAQKRPGKSSRNNV